MRLLVILQNAYGVEEGYVPSYNRQSFVNSHTGKRLKEMLPEIAETFIVNASSRVGTHASSIFPPEPAYVLGYIKEYAPDCILACGKVAEEAVNALTEIDMPIIYAPHPAYRALSKRMTADIRSRILVALGERNG